MNVDDLFTAPQVAKICSTDLKTIHNWVNRGEIKSFRTPGRHLRFRREDILDFLTRFGYPIPEGFAPTRKRVVLYDAEENSLRAFKRVLAKDFEVEAFSDQVDALLAIGRDRPSLVLIGGEGGQNGEVMHMVERLASKKDTYPIAVYGETNSCEQNARSAGASDFILTNDGKEIKRRLVSLMAK